MDAFWKGLHYLSNWDDTVLPHTYTPEDGEAQWRLKTRASGHDFGQGNNCAEFCYNTHSVNVDGAQHGVGRSCRNAQTIRCTPRRHVDLRPGWMVPGRTCPHRRPGAHTVGGGAGQLHGGVRRHLRPVRQLPHGRSNHRLRCAQHGARRRGHGHSGAQQEQVDVPPQPRVRRPCGAHSEQRKRTLVVGGVDLRDCRRAKPNRHASVGPAFGILGRARRRLALRRRGVPRRR